MNTRNPTEAEIQVYEDLQTDHEEAKQTLKEVQTALQERYLLPDETGLTPDGVFVNSKGQPLRRAVKGNAPAHLVHKCTRDDLNGIVRARIAVQKTANIISRYILDLRKECCAPHFAGLSTEHKWITPDTQRPLVVGDEEDDKPKKLALVEDDADLYDDGDDRVEIAEEE